MKTTHLANTLEFHISIEDRVLELVKISPMYINHIAEILEINRNLVGRIIDDLYESLLIDKRRVGNGQLISYKEPVKWPDTSWCQ